MSGTVALGPTRDEMLDLLEGAKYALEGLLDGDPAWSEADKVAGRITDMLNRAHEIEMKQELLALRERFFSCVHPEPNTGCWLWSGTDRGNGYGQFYMNGKREVAHRASYKLLVSSIPEGLVICHRCDVPFCVNPDHLFVATKGDNNRDRHSKGRSASGVPLSLANGRRKLTVDEVREIKASSGGSRRLADQYGVGPTQIRRIQSGESWSWVETETSDGENT